MGWRIWEMGSVVEVPVHEIPALGREMVGKVLHSIVDGLHKLTAALGRLFHEKTVYLDQE
jgi:hypothetical protein